MTFMGSASLGVGKFRLTALRSCRFDAQSTLKNCPAMLHLVGHFASASRRTGGLQKAV